MKKIVISIIMVFFTITVHSQIYTDSVNSPKTFDRAAMWSVQNLENVNITDNIIYGYYVFNIRGGKVTFSVKIEKINKYLTFTDNVYIKFSNFNHKDIRLDANNSTHTRRYLNYSAGNLSKVDCPKNLSKKEWDKIKKETEKESIAFMNKIKSQIDFNPLSIY